MATNILKSINKSVVPTDFNRVNNCAKIQKINPSDEDSKYRVESSKQIITIRIYTYIHIYIYIMRPKMIKFYSVERVLNTI